jgi:SAM-dependent methyltransferase
LADWYDSPRYYDIVFDEGTADEARFLEQVLAKHGAARFTNRGTNRGARRVLEPACGSGRLVAALAARGCAVTGFDRNAHMLAYAEARLRRRRLSARLVRGELARFCAGAGFDLAHCLVSTFKYLLDERAARAHLRCVARALAPGGIYVLGLHLTDYGRRTRERERWTAARGGTRVVCNTQVWPADRHARLERVRNRLEIESRGRRARIETHWSFRTYDARELRALLRAVPELELVAQHDFTYDIGRERSWDESHDDRVLVLRRRRAGVH